MASLSSTASLAVSATTRSVPRSISLRYLGATARSQTNNLLTKRFSDDYFTQFSFVDENYINYQVDLARGNLLLQSDVNAIINGLESNGSRTYPTSSGLSTILSGYTNSTALGAANGIAKANSAGAVDVSQIPSGIQSDNKAVFINCIADTYSSLYMTSTYGATTSSIVEYRAASVVLKDPGFPYYPMNFVYIQGKSSGSVTNRADASTNTGLITVAAAPAQGQQLPTLIFAQGTATPSPYRNWHMALPYANKWTGNPPVRTQTGTTAFRGDLTLNLYLTNYQGSGYTFYPGFTWYCIMMPTNTATVSA